MATVSDRSLRPRSITRIADESGLTRPQVTTLIDDHEVPTHYVGNTRLVDSSDWPRLERLINRHIKKRLKRKAAGRPLAPGAASPSPSVDT